MRQDAVIFNPSWLVYRKDLSKPINNEKTTYLLYLQNLNGLKVSDQMVFLNAVRNGDKKVRFCEAGQVSGLSSHSKSGLLKSRYQMQISANN